MDAYAKTYESAEPDDRFAKYATTTKQYYNLVTDFYEYGWGQSFHFAVRHRNESMKQSIAEHQRFLAEKLGLSRGKKAIDLGCGVGGPMRTVARLTGADVTGVNITAYQVERAKKYNEREGLAGQCTVLESDFLKVRCPTAPSTRPTRSEATAMPRQARCSVSGAPEARRHRGVRGITPVAATRSPSIGASPRHRKATAAEPRHLDEKKASPTPASTSRHARSPPR
jgi:hypothetical protein